MQGRRNDEGEKAKIFVEKHLTDIYTQESAKHLQSQCMHVRCEYRNLGLNVKILPSIYIHYIHV
jgi:hypothetical protein